MSAARTWLPARGPGRPRTLQLMLLILLVLPPCGTARAQSAAQPPGTVPEGDFIYHARLHDTLIGIGRRLLLQPRRWVEVQARNRIPNPRRIPPGSPIRIPFAWLRLGADAATVTATGGQVRADGRAAVNGMQLAEGSRLQTGADGSVTLQLADGSVVTLQKASSLTLQELRSVSGVPATHDTRLKLEAGRLQTVVKPQGSDGRFEILTPVAVSAVRGTQFRSAFDAASAQATTETLEGVVGVSGSAASVTLPANFGTRVERNAAPLPPVQLLPPPDLAGLPAANGAPRLRLAWPAVPGATAYRVQLAPDAGFHSFLIDTRSTAAQVEVPAPADGSYWLRVRSIDRFGLEGRDAVRRLAQRLLPAAPVLAAPPPGASVFGDAARLAWSGPAGVGYRVQVARDAAFTEVVLDRNAGAATRLDIGAMPPGQYFWRAASIAGGRSGDWSTPRSYVQRPSAPAAGIPVRVGRRLQFSWEARAQVRYELQVARDPAFHALLVQRGVDSPALSIPVPRPGAYYARLRLLAPDGTASPFGPVSTFDVPVPLWVKILMPVLALLAFVR